MRSNLFRISGFLFFVLWSGFVAGQTSVSPYSIFGNGERETGRFAQQISLGGITAGLRDPLQLNIVQPASYAALEYTTIEIGGFYQETWLSDDAQTIQTNNGGFNYLAFGFPLAEGFGMSVGVLPYSKVGYDVRAQTSYSFSDAKLEYQGDGGFDRFYFGAAYELFEGFTLGLNGSYFFGSTERITTALFEDNNYYDVSREENLSANGFSWDAGIQYVLPIGEDGMHELVLGASYVPQTVLNGTLNDLTYTFLESPTGLRSYKDTVYGISDQGVDVVFNSNYSAGFTFGGRHEQLVQYAWSFGADYQMLNRNELSSSSEVRGEFVQGYRVSFGGNLIPYYTFDLESRNYFGQIDYRLGGYHENTGLMVNNESITDQGVTFGMGFPIGRRVQSPGDVKLATLNFGMVLGRRGTSTSGNIEETFTRFVIGLTLNDKWFTQFKYR